jgi:hypothetical protein
MTGRAAGGDGHFKRRESGPDPPVMSPEVFRRLHADEPLRPSSGTGRKSNLPESLSQSPVAFTPPEARGPSQPRRRSSLPESPLPLTTPEARRQRQPQRRASEEGYSPLHSGSRRKNAHSPTPGVCTHPHLYLSCTFTHTWQTHIYLHGCTLCQQTRFNESSND